MKCEIWLLRDQEVEGRLVLTDWFPLSFKWRWTFLNWLFFPFVYPWLLSSLFKNTPWNTFCLQQVLLFQQFWFKMPSGADLEAPLSFQMTQKGPCGGREILRNWFFKEQKVILTWMTTCLLSGRLRWRIFSSLLRFLTVVWPQVWRRRKWLHQQTQRSSGRDSKAHSNLNIWNKIRRLLTDEAAWPLTSLWSIYPLLVEELQVCRLWSGAVTLRGVNRVGCDDGCGVFLSAGKWANIWTRTCQPSVWISSWATHASTKVRPQQCFCCLQ